jgi:tetratricopeptide (TPR) repeat protein
VSSQTKVKNLQLRQPRPHPSKATILAICVFLAAITWLVFGQTLRHEFINYDDDKYVYENAEVTAHFTLHGTVWAFTHSHANNWHPLTWISHMLDYQLFGLKAGGHHFTNVLLHTIAVLLLFLVLCQMTGSIWRSAFVAALFAIHPLRVESVAWVAERKDVLSGVFFMLTLGAYLRYARQQTLVRYLIVALLFAFGLMSKPMLVTVPFVLLLLDYWPLQRQWSWRRLIVEKIPLLALSAASCLVTLSAQKDLITSIERLPVAQRIGNALISCVTYMHQMAWPTRLAVFYPYHLTSFFSAEVILAALLLIAITIVAIIARRKFPYIIIGWFWYLIMLVPVIGVVQVGIQAHADRYTYLPEIGLSILATWMMVDLAAAWRFPRKILGAAAVIIISVLVWRASFQASYWRDSEEIWRHTLAVTANNSIAHNNLGNALLQKNKIDEAMAQFQQAAEISPHDTDVQNSLGNALFRNGKVVDAITHYRIALQLQPNNAEVRNNLGNALFHTGQIDEAITYFQSALQLLSAQSDVRATEAHYNLGNALFQKGQIDDAIAHYRKAVEVNSDYSAEAHYNLGNAFLRKEQLDEAILHYQKTLELQPEHSNAHNNLGNALRQKGLTKEAILHFREAWQNDPSSVQYQNNLAWMLATCSDAPLRDGVKAVELAEQANQLSGSNNPTILHTLAAAYAESGRLSEAIATAQRAIELADTQSNAALAESLKRELALYQTGMPYHEPIK